ncbi:hypothetical protein [Paenibacillus sp. y28]|uniref:hypothetical protein n=1 Tax=Paenibacillus sp. y28 TaxID=3129110 RepID=UPI003016EAFD
MKKKVSTIVMATMISLTSVVSPAFAQTEVLQVNSYNYYDNTYIDATRIKLHVVNEGEYPFGHPDSITYYLYNYNGDLLRQGQLFPNQRLWEGTQWNWSDEYEAEFETTSGGFNLDLYCDGYFSVCNGSATIEVLE